jgi:outer membrane protein
MKIVSSIAVGILLLSVVGVASAAPVVPQQDSPIKIAIIDTDRVLSEWNLGRTLAEQAQGEADSWQSRIDQKRQELDQLRRQRQEQALTMTDEEIRRTNAQIQQGQVDLQRLQEDANRTMQRLDAQYQSQISAELTPVLERIAQQDGYDLILNAQTQGLLFFSPAIDVTDRFIEMLNAGVQGDRQ